MNEGLATRDDSLAKGFPGRRSRGVEFGVGDGDVVVEMLEIRDVGYCGAGRDEYGQCVRVWEYAGVCCDVVVNVWDAEECKLRR